MDEADKDDLLQALRLEAEAQRSELGQLRNVLSKVRAQEEAARRGEEDIHRLQAEVQSRREEVRRLRYALLGPEGQNVALIEAQPEAPQPVNLHRGSRFRQANQNVIDAGKDIHSGGELASETCIRGAWDPLATPGRAGDSVARYQHGAPPPSARAGRRNMSPRSVGKATPEWQRSTRLNQPPWRPSGRFHADAPEFLSRPSSPCESVRRTPPGSPRAPPPPRQQSPDLERRGQKEVNKEMWGTSPKDQTGQQFPQATTSTSSAQRSRSAGSPSPSPSSSWSLREGQIQRRQTATAPMDESGIASPPPRQFTDLTRLVRSSQTLRRKESNPEANQWYDYPEPMGKTMKTIRLWPSVLSPPPSSSCAQQDRIVAGTSSSSGGAIRTPSVPRAVDTRREVSRIASGSPRPITSNRVLVGRQLLDTSPFVSNVGSTPSLSYVTESMYYQAPAQWCSMSAASGASSLVAPVIGGVGTPGGFSSVSGSTGIANQASMASTTGFSAPIDRMQGLSARSVYENFLNGTTAPQLSASSSFPTPRLATSSPSVRSMPVLTPMTQTQVPTTSVSIPMTPAAVQHVPTTSVTIPMTPPAVQRAVEAPIELAARTQGGSFSAELFNIVDANSDGVISREEFRKALHAKLLNAQVPRQGQNA